MDKDSIFTWLLVFPIEQYTFPHRNQGSRYQLFDEGGQIDDKKHAQCINM